MIELDGRRQTAGTGFFADRRRTGYCHRRLVAEDLHLGTGGGTLVLSAVFAVILALGKQSRWTTKASYWLAIIAVRSAGTTAGDWLAFREKPGLSNGLHLGLPLSTAFTCALFVGSLFLWSARRSHSGGAQ